MMLKSALLSIRTLTPSCSTVSSKAPGFSTYSRWYAKPLHPRFRTPTLISFGSGWSSSSLNCSTAEGVNFIAALRARSLDRGRAAFGFWVSFSFSFGVGAEDTVEGVAFCVVVASCCVGGCGVFCSWGGGLVSWTLGRGSGCVIEVSGTSSFLGGVEVWAGRV